MRKLHHVLALTVGLATLASCGNRTDTPTSAQKLLPRVVSLAPNLTEIVVAVGAGDKLVGRTSVCNYPPDIVKRIPSIGGFGDPSMELLVSVKPTLILEVDVADVSIRSRIDSLGIRRELIPCNTLAEIPRAITRIGELTGTSDRAAELARSIVSGIETFKSSASTSPPLVFIEIWDDPLTTAGKNSYISELIAMAGGRNAGDEFDKDYVTVSDEWVVNVNPDVIIDMHYMGRPPVAERYSGRIGWKNVKALQSGRINAGLDQDLILRPGPRVLEAIQQIRKCIVALPGKETP